MPNTRDLYQWWKCCHPILSPCYKSLLSTHRDCMTEVLEKVFIGLENSLLHICHQALVVNPSKIVLSCIPRDWFPWGLNPNTNNIIRVDEYKKITVCKIQTFNPEPVGWSQNLTQAKQVIENKANSPSWGKIAIWLRDKWAMIKALIQIACGVVEGIASHCTQEWSVWCVYVCVWQLLGYIQM